jgi:PAS domain S-box-containing protein
MRQELEDLTTRWEAPPGSVPSALIVLNDGARVVEWNPAAEEMFGMAADDVKGQRLESLHLPQDLDWQPLLG